MKKLLLSVALLMAVLPACAVNWEMIDTDIPNLDLYIDTDSIIYANDTECYYAIKYKEGDKPEKYAYLKSNSETNYIGVISTGETAVDAYKPQVVFNNPHVFMKPVSANSFLSYAHEYSTTRQSDEIASRTAPSLRDDAIKPVGYRMTNDLRKYAQETAMTLEDNWNPPSSGRNTQAVIIVTIGVDGSLQNYKFEKSSGDEGTDRSIISAVEKSVPYMSFPRQASCNNPINLKFAFDYNLFKKSVTKY